MLPGVLFSDPASRKKIGLVRRMLRILGPAWQFSPLRRLIQILCFLLFCHFFFDICWPYRAAPDPNAAGWPSHYADDFESREILEAEIFLALDENADGVFDSTWSDSVDFTIEPKPPVLLVPSDSVQMGDAPVGIDKHASYWLFNGGGQVLTIDGLEIEGADFSLTNSPETPTSLAPGEWSVVVLTYTPSMPGPGTGMLTIHSNDPDQTVLTVPLEGVGTEAIVPVPLIKANGESETLSVSNGTRVDVSIELDAGDYTGREMEWWLKAETPFAVFWLTPSGWQESAAPLSFLQAPIGSFPSITVFSLPIVPGEYTFRFCLDSESNGSYDPTYVDDVAVVAE